VQTRLCASKGEARRHLQGGAVTINRQRVSDDKLLIDQTTFADKYFLLIGLGKTHLHLILK
jgi:tyrosyl-tRNA synthetase